MVATRDCSDEKVNEFGLGQPRGLPKAPTGIAGLDEVTGGGLPRGRSTLVCGPTGCGKTLLAVEFIVRGITEFDEPGVVLTFEESAGDLAANVASLGFNLAKLEADRKLIVDSIDLSGGDFEEVGDWNLDGLFLRLGASIDAIGAKRVVIDTMEMLFGYLPNASVLRSEMRRLFEWLKKRNVTTVITGERGEGTLTRHGLEEYVSDCVIVLDHRVTDQTSTRRLRVLKYRGSLHGTNEYPFLIGVSGVSVIPITENGLKFRVSKERISTGVPRLDAMLSDGGFHRGSTVLISGTAGTGKSTLAAQFCDAACRRGERAIYFGFEESEAEIVRNTSSMGMDLQRWIDAGLLRFECFRPSLLGLEAHLFQIQQCVTDFDPAVVVKDPVSDLMRLGTELDVTTMLTRQVDFFKASGVTAMFTTIAGLQETASEKQMTSLVDTWIRLKVTEGNGEFNRVLYVLKSRGMSHSNQIREFLLTDDGIELTDVYVGPQGVLTGSARQAQEAKERAEITMKLEDLEERRINLVRRREAVEAQTALLWQEFADEADAVERLLADGSTGFDNQAGQRAAQAILRNADDSDDAAKLATT